MINCLGLSRAFLVLALKVSSSRKPLNPCVGFGLTTETHYNINLTVKMAFSMLSVLWSFYLISDDRVPRRLNHKPRYTPETECGSIPALSHLGYPVILRNIILRSEIRPLILIFLHKLPLGPLVHFL
jgi:hypothetical protein